ncbi:MAG: FAD-binding oxidoreductase [Alphaproteobacteria bacterium]|nr:FAD-binding oxidoreductase [Alphaproteobacteria bacterium]
MTPPFFSHDDPAPIEGYLPTPNDLRGEAEALVRPRDTQEVAEVMRWCQARGTPLTITAKRTSTTGGPVPHGGWLLSTERLDRVLELGQDHAVAEGGVLLGELQDQLEARGRLFPPDPTSRYDCSLGGAIACNASGARSYRYGPTRPWVEAVEVVLPTGEVLQADCYDTYPRGLAPLGWTEPAVKTAAGLYPADNLLDPGSPSAARASLGLTVPGRTPGSRTPLSVFSVLAYFLDRGRPGLVRPCAACRRSLPAASSGTTRSLLQWPAACLRWCPRAPGRRQVWCEQECAEAELTGFLEAWLGRSRPP